MDTAIESYNNLLDPLDSLTQSLKEMMLMRSGELPKRSWDAFAAEMRKEIADDENK
jgi:hypothetical protein